MVGAMVGGVGRDVVGAGVGVPVGVRVGAGVGLFVGVGVGTLEGSGVGACVMVPTLHFTRMNRALGQVT